MSKLVHEKDHVEQNVLVAGCPLCQALQRAPLFDYVAHAISSSEPHRFPGKVERKGVPVESPVQVKVLEAYARDVGIIAARVNFETLGISRTDAGSLIEVQGKKRTIAKAFPLSPSDAGRRIIRCDFITRGNAEMRVNDWITVKKVKRIEAEKITFALTDEKGEERAPILFALDENGKPKGPTSPEYLARTLEGVPFVKGDKISFPVFGARWWLRVLEERPDGATVSSARTQFEYAGPL